MIFLQKTASGREKRKKAAQGFNFLCFNR